MTTPISERRLPPVDRLGALALALVILGGITMAAHMPTPTTLTPSWILCGLAACVLLTAVALLLRVRECAWGRFRQVAGWALLAYLCVAGMIAYAFIYDGTRGAPLLLALSMLTIFALVVPLLLGFAVARFQPVGDREGHSS